VLSDGGAHWRRLANKTEPSVCGGDAAFCQITLTTCYLLSSSLSLPLMMKMMMTMIKTIM